MKDYDYEGFKDFMNHFYHYDQYTLSNELDLLDRIDDQVALMDTYPDAEQLLKNIFS